MALSCQWLDSNDDPINITGVTFTAFEIVPASLTAYATATVTDGPTGTFSITCPWNAYWPPNEGAVVKIRFQASNGKAVPEIDVVLQ